MPTRRVCSFCQDKKDPDYKDADSLRVFVSERGRVLSGYRTGICAKHQRRLSTAIKRARHLSLLPFVASV